MQVSVLIYFILHFYLSSQMNCLYPETETEKMSPKFYIPMCLGFALKIQVLIANILLLMKHQYF